MTPRGRREATVEGTMCGARMLEGTTPEDIKEREVEHSSESRIKAVVEGVIGIEVRKEFTDALIEADVEVLEGE